MRVVKEIPHPELKITVYNWNNRYLLKFETGYLEQTYKINEYDVSSEEELLNIINNEFLSSVMESFQTMATSFRSATSNI